MLLLNSVLLPVGSAAEIPVSRFYVKVEQNGQTVTIKDTTTLELKRQAFTLKLPVKEYDPKDLAAYSVVIYPHPFVWDRRLLKESHDPMLQGMATYRTGYDCMYLRNAGHYLVHQKGGRVSLKKGQSLGSGWFEGTWTIDGYQFFDLQKYSQTYGEVFSELDARNKWFESKDCKPIAEFPFRYLYFLVVIRSKSMDLPTPKQVVRFRVDFGSDKH